MERAKLLPDELRNGLEKITTVVWDFDGVISDTEPVQAKAYAVLLERYGIVVRNGFFEDLIGRPESEIASVLIEQHQLPDSHSAFVARRSSLYLEMAMDLEPAWFVRPILECSNQIEHVIVSSGSYEHIEPLLHEWKLDQYFSTISCNGVPGIEPKPKSERLTQVIDESTQPVLCLEDNERYLNTAKQLGAFTVGVQHDLNNLREGPWDVLLKH